MTAYILISSVLIVIIFLTLGYILYRVVKIDRNNPSQAQVHENDKLAKITELGNRVWALLTFAILLVFFSFSAPFLFTRISASSDFNFTQTGQIGDTIGGLMNPFISLAGVVVTGLAFYIQYRANILQRELFIGEQSANKSHLQQQIDSQNAQIRHQQFESQFYEMLRLHRDNISEMKIEGYDFKEGNGPLEKFEKDTEGRKIFVTMKTELECILGIIEKDRVLDQNAFEIAYRIFFSGLDEFAKESPREKAIINRLLEARKLHETPNENIFIKYKEKRIQP